MKRYKVLDLFAGGGGFSAGFLMASYNKCSFEIIRAVDSDEDACRTLAVHLGEERVIKGDITQEDIKRRIIEEAKDADVIIGGPPCQTFSLAGPARSGSKEIREKLKNDSRNILYRHFVDIVKSVKPHFVVFENVEGIVSKNLEVCKLTKKHKKAINLICDELELAGYTLNLQEFPDRRFRILNSVDYGVPQQRRRVIIIANRYGLLNPFPEKMYNGNGKSCKTLRDAIGHLPVVLPEVNLKGVATLKNINVIIERLAESIGTFVNFINCLSTEYAGRKEISSQQFKLLKAYLNSEYINIKNNKNAGFNELIKFLEKYNIAVRDLNKKTESISQVRYHRCRSHNFRDIIIFCKMKPGTDSSQFTSINSEFYDRLLDRLYPYGRTKHKDTYKKHSWDKPANTILSHLERDGLRFIHPDQPRTFTPYEAALIQSFPPDYHFEGSTGSQYRQIGNAVPPLLAKSIGECILRVINQTV